MKRIVRKLFPKLYLFIASVKGNVKYCYKEYLELKRQNQCIVSLYKYMINYCKYGCLPTEYNFLGFKNLNKKGKNTFITYRRNVKIQKDSNPKCIDVLCSKNLFNDYFSDFIKRKWIYITKDTTDEQINNFYNSLQEKKFIIKPNNLRGGLGIRIGHTIEELYDLKNDGILVEEIVKNHESISILNPTSLNTIRVVTVVDNNNIPHIVAMTLRTGGKGSVIDNAHGGGTFYHIDLSTGIIDTPARDSYGNYYVKHPTSEMVMLGFLIPHFDELKQYSIDLASKLHNARYVGWDIAITTNAFEVIEGNVYPSSELSQCNNVGLYNTIKYYLEN
jgi:hypothetical protein